LIATGVTITNSLHYSFIIAIAAPVGPLLAVRVADKFERKWQIVAAALCIGVFGLLFSRQTNAGFLIAFGVLLTCSNNWMSMAFHAYQPELFPTRVRAQAVGFVYSWSRVKRHFHQLTNRLLPARLWRRRSLHLHRLLDAGRDDVNRDLGTADARVGARGYLTLKQIASRLFDSRQRFEFALNPRFCVLPGYGRSILSTTLLSSATSAASICVSLERSQEAQPFLQASRFSEGSMDCANIRDGDKAMHAIWVPICLAEAHFGRFVKRDCPVGLSKRCEQSCSE